jgi:hypothetical protein
VTAGPHGRQTRLAYQRAFNHSVPIGVICVPIERYDARVWWLSRFGIWKTTKDFAGWLYELLFGPRDGKI